MTFAPRIRKPSLSSAFAAPYGGLKLESNSEITHFTRTGVNLVGTGRNRKAVVTVREGNSLVYLGSGTVEQANEIYDAYKKEQAARLKDRTIRKAANNSFTNKQHG